MLTGYNEWLIGYSSELNTVDHRHTQWTHKAQYTVIHLHTKYIESAPGLTLQLELHVVYLCIHTHGW